MSFVILCNILGWKLHSFLQSSAESTASQMGLILIVAVFFCGMMLVLYLMTSLRKRVCQLWVMKVFSGIVILFFHQILNNIGYVCFFIYIYIDSIW